MKTYYLSNKDACKRRALLWASQNPVRKQEINRASNLRIHVEPVVQWSEPADHQHTWAEFLREHSIAVTQQEKDETTYAFLTENAASVNTIPTNVEEILADYEERQ